MHGAAKLVNLFTYFVVGYTEDIHSLLADANKDGQT